MTDDTHGEHELSVAIITLNEERHLPALLRAVGPVAGEIVVVDSGSTDGTVEIAREAGARVIQTDWPGFGPQKQRALEACRGRWVFSVDADEVPDEELLRALARLSRGEGDADVVAYEVDRLNAYLGEYVRHAWSPDWCLRVLRRDAGRWSGDAVHERLLIDGKVGRLPGRLLHDSYDDLTDHYRRMISYARLGARGLAAKGKRFRAHYLVTRPLAAFVRRYLLKRGFLDGVRGLLVAGATAIGVFFKYAFLFELAGARRGRSKRRRGD
jgi:glycosyltransferase involved in cell wall biosynthesis